MLQSFFLKNYTATPFLFLQRLYPRKRTIRHARGITLFRRDAVSVTSNNVPRKVIRFLNLQIRGRISLTNVLRIRITRRTTHLTNYTKQRKFRNRRTTRKPIFQRVFHRGRDIFLTFRAFFRRTFRVVRHLTRAYTVFIRPLSTGFLPCHRDSIPATRNIQVFQADNRTNSLPRSLCSTTRRKRYYDDYLNVPPYANRVQVATHRVNFGVLPPTRPIVYVMFRFPFSFVSRVGG